jgi:glycosyltransferase involved in cell wall biosynthesis
MTGSTLSVMPRLSGARVLILNWRDTRHPEAGGAEQYMHQIARRWVRQGVKVTWFTARPEGMAAHEVIDGIQITRFGGPLSLYPLTALRLLHTRGKFDAVVDCQNGIPFFSPLFAGAGVPVVLVVHHVHQDQFSTRFSAPIAAVGRFLEGRVARWVYGSRAIAAVSPSTRLELRRRLGFRGPIFVVPNGTIDVPTISGTRDPHPTIVVVSRLVPHKRMDLLLGQIASAARKIPRLRVDMVGDGPERSRLQNLAVDLGLQTTVTFHGYHSDETRDKLLSRAWVTTSTAAAEGWGCSVIEAAAWGVPCVALNVPGIRDSVLNGQTGCFSWDRSAELLAGVLLKQAAKVTARHVGSTERRYARSDIGTLARFPSPKGVDFRAVLRSTDEIVEHGETTSMLLSGCDEFDAAAVLQRVGVLGAELRLIGRRDLLAGPTAALIPVNGHDFTAGDTT